MARTLLTIIVACSLAGIGSADAASKKKKVHHVAPAPAMSAPYVARMPSARTPGPIWANPNECYTDEGYGRYWPCGAGRDGGR